jgi:hypothetical protein
VNRDIEQAAQGNSVGEAVYNEYHNCIKDIIGNLTGRGLLVDIHGQVGNLTDITNYKT